jgi:hypothetical protein
MKIKVLREGIIMKKIRFLKVLGIGLFLFVSLFFIANRSLAEKPWIELDNIDESADDAQFIKWEIKAEKAYDVVVYMEDDDGNDFSIVFRTRDDENEYDTSDKDRLVVGIGKEDDYYIDDTKRTYESKSFTYLTSKHSSENSSITYNFDDDAMVNKIRIYGEDFKLYYIALADSDYFDDLCWEREASGWGNFWNFQNDNGKISNDTSINFSSSYISVTEKSTSYVPPYGGIYGGLYGMYGIGGYYGGSPGGIYFGYGASPGGPQYGMYGSNYYGGPGGPQYGIYGISSMYGGISNPYGPQYPLYGNPRGGPYPPYQPPRYPGGPYSPYQPTSYPGGPYPPYKPLSYPGGPYPPYQPPGYPGYSIYRPANYPVY